MFPKLLLLILLSAVFQSGLTQSLKGVVIDEATGESLGYATIGIVGKNKGVISYMDGRFQIDVNENSKDTLRFSYIGYKAQFVPITSLNLSKENVIKLSPEAYILNPIEVSGDVHVRTLGNNKVGRTFTGWGDFESSRGRMRGLIIEGAECPVRVKSFSFRINHNDWDSVRFRLNFKNIDGISPGESILKSNIFITTSLKHKWVKVDLTSHNIVICNRVLVMLEWVDAWGSAGKFSNMLTLSYSKSNGYTLVQEPGENCATISEGIMPAMFLEVYE